MTPNEIRAHRLYNQQVSVSSLKTPEAIVNKLIAMQAQEYAMAKWAIGLRLKNSSDTLVENAFNEGRILRTHLLRPTWHFVAPQDIRWLLQLTAPRVQVINRSTYKRLEITPAIFKKSQRIIAKALEGNRALERGAIGELLGKNNIDISDIRLSALMMEAELEGLVCSGPRKGKQFTYMLLEERVPFMQPMSREEALQQFARRYFETRGPATAEDFAYWSGLTLRDARNGAAMLPGTFLSFERDGATYFYKPLKIAPLPEPHSFLMPDYDEYGMSYKNRRILFPETPEKKELLYNRMIVIDGLIQGTWKRTLLKNDVLVETFLFAPSAAREKIVQQLIRGYSNFVFS